MTINWHPFFLVCSLQNLEIFGVETDDWKLWALGISRFLCLIFHGNGGHKSYGGERWKDGSDLRGILSGRTWLFLFFIFSDELSSQTLSSLSLWHKTWGEREWERLKIDPLCYVLEHKVDLGHIRVESTWNLWLFMALDQIFSGTHSPSHRRTVVSFAIFPMIGLHLRDGLMDLSFAVDWLLRAKDRNTRFMKAPMAAEYGPLTSPAEKPRRLNSSLFSLPRLFTALNPSPNTEPVISPTSILDSKPFSGLKTSFWSEASTPRTPEPEKKTVVIGSLGLVEVLKDDELNDSKPSKMVLFGSQLRIQVPSQPPPALAPALDCPRSPSDFGIKTQNSQTLSPSPLKQSAISPPNVAVNSPRPLLASEITEMELSEDYTCVISYGPNPKTVHIFGDCIVESCCGEDGFSPASLSDNGFSADDHFSSPSTPSECFLSFCQTCKKNLGPGSDIYIYRSVHFLW